MAFIQKPFRSDEAPGAPDAAVYENQGGNCVDSLKELSEEIEVQMGIARQAEPTNLQCQLKFELSLLEEAALAEAEAVLAVAAPPADVPNAVEVVHAVELPAEEVQHELHEISACHFGFACGEAGRVERDQCLVFGCACRHRVQG